MNSLMDPSVEFLLVNNITVRIPELSLPLIQQVSKVPERDTHNEQQQESLTNITCDTKNPQSINIPPKGYKEDIPKATTSSDQNFFHKDTKTKKSPKGKKEDEKEICKVCSKEFSSIVELFQHRVKEHGFPTRESYQCAFCESSFEEKSSLIRHILVHVNTDYIECPDCSQVFLEISPFLQHLDDHTVLGKNAKIVEEVELKGLSSDDEDIPGPCGENQMEERTESPKNELKDLQGDLEWQKRDNKVRPFSCNICQRSFTLASSLALHEKRTHLGIRPHECLECGWKFAQSSDLQKHMRKHTGDRPYQCDFCGLAFTQHRNLKNHKKIHTDQPSRCKYCSKDFAIDTSLIAHLKKHEGPEVNPCDVCGIPWTTTKDLEHHKRKHHRDSRPHGCQCCEKRFVKKADLLKHERIHTGEKPHICPICHKSFTHPTSLRNHKMVHTGEKPFQCTVCGHAFGFAGNLKVHMRSHSGERPFTCPTCQRSFARTANLNEHIKIHTGEKSYRCDVCGKAFTNSSTFSKHKKIHTGIRPHTCPLCPKAFLQNAHLTKHLRIHTGERPYNCTICGKFFRRTDTLSSHMKTHRDTKVPPGIIHFTFVAPTDAAAPEESLILTQL